MRRTERPVNRFFNANRQKQSRKKVAGFLVVFGAGICCKGAIMNTTFHPIMVLWYVFPVIVLLAASYLTSALSLQKKWQIKGADLAVPFLWLGLHQISVNSFSVSILPYFVIAVLFLGILLVIFQAYYYGEIAYKRYFKMLWRLIFLFTLLSYLLLIIVDIVHYL